MPGEVAREGGLQSMAPFEVANPCCVLADCLGEDVDDDGSLCEEGGTFL